MSRVLGDVFCEIMYLLENASPHNVLEVATSNFACA